MTFVEHHIEPDDLHLHCSDLLQLLQVPDHSPDNPVVHEAIELFGQLSELTSIQGGYMVYDNPFIDKRRDQSRSWINKSTHNNRFANT